MWARFNGRLRKCKYDLINRLIYKYFIEYEYYEYYEYHENYFYFLI